MRRPVKRLSRHMLASLRYSTVLLTGLLYSPLRVATRAYEISHALRGHYIMRKERCDAV